jgi:hypothetical protein
VVNLGYRMDNPTEPFEVVEILDRTEKGLCVRLKTEGGVKLVWIPFKVGTLYEYQRDGKIFREVMLPRWFSKKTGLIQTDS